MDDVNSPYLRGANAPSARADEVTGTGSAWTWWAGTAFGLTVEDFLAWEGAGDRDQGGDCEEEEVHVGELGIWKSTYVVECKDRLLMDNERGY